MQGEFGTAPSLFLECEVMQLFGSVPDSIDKILIGCCISQQECGIAHTHMAGTLDWFLPVFYIIINRAGQSDLTYVMVISP